MSEQTASPKNNHRLVLAVVAVAALTFFLGGFTNARRGWKEGDVAPAAVYAPFDFSVEEKGAAVEVKRGELLVSRGQRLTQQQVARLEASEEILAGKRRFSHGWGALGLSILFAAMGAVYLKRSEPKIWRNTSHLVLILLAVNLIMGLGRLVSSSPLSAEWIPVATVSMFLSMLFSPRLGVAFGLMTTILTALIAGASLPWVAAASMGCFVGAYGMRGVRRRIHFFRIGLLTGAAQGLTVLAGDLLMSTPFLGGLGESAATVGCGFVSALITFCLLPLAESFFGLMTDVSLLELSDLNHPLLRELSVKAPGTYHHSLIVANLAEAAGEAVGANALLARVGCYFHDIGKMLHPEYFVENQPPKHSRHDTLVPSMSTLVILNHVKDGMELARRYRLNDAIIDFIPGHHGTGLIYYFYRRALEEVEDDTLLKEERFRYPGPKPQTKETAIALLADSVEAATRALKEKSPTRLEEVVRRIINNKFIDGQLDDCDLTLRDLDRIAQSFLRVLAGIYHHRVEYPQAPGEEPDAVAHAG